MRLNILLFMAALLSLSSCVNFGEPEFQTEYQPILMTRSQLEKSVSYQPARAFINTGKIYQKGYYIYINEKYKGIHVIDNHNASAPQNIGFISAPGCIDIAAKGNTLYLDNAVDLVAVDITNLQQAAVTERVKNVFPELLPPDSDFLPSEYSQGRRLENTVIVGWEKKSI